MGGIIMENFLSYKDDVSLQFDVKKVGRFISWSNEQIKYIIEQYEYKEIPITSIAKKFGCSDASVRRLLTINNVQIRNKSLQRNSDYFENIDSRDKAYWLGIMYSDGCVCERKNGTCSISLEMIDKEHIEKFRDALNAVDHKISTKKHEGFENAKLSYSIHIYDKKMAKDLINLGCVPRKSLSLSSIPNIPQEFIYDFIRGFVDGDGCICYDKAHDSYVFKLTGAAPLFLKDIMRVLEIDKLSLNKCTKTSYQATSGNRDDIYRILTQIYKYSTEATRLDRKYKKYQEFVQWYEQKNN